jgi:hypothetical protein
MSDFNPLDRARVAVHRSSFDLSSKKLFTAKIGEILPCKNRRQNQNRNRQQY